METNVPDQPREGEPENVTPEPCHRADLPELADMMCAGCGTRAGDHPAWLAKHPRKVPAPELVNDRYALSPLERQVDAWMAKHAGRTYAEAVVVDHAAALAEDEARSAPERRTVSLEVLTSELRRVGNALIAARAADVGEKKPQFIPDDALVGVVIREGDLVEVFDTDAAWRRVDKGEPVAILRSLLSMMPSANGLHGLPHTDLLMPTPDVLAVLAGQPDTRLLSAPVHVLAMDIQAGMLLRSTDDDGDGAETLELVSAERDCTDRDCIYGATCVVLTVEGHEDPDVHFNGFARIEVRIPAAEVVAP